MIHAVPLLLLLPSVTAYITTPNNVNVGRVCGRNMLLGDNCDLCPFPFGGPQCDMCVIDDRDGSYPHALLLNPELTTSSSDGVRGVFPYCGDGKYLYEAHSRAAQGTDHHPPCNHAVTCGDRAEEVYWNATSQRCLCRRCTFMWEGECCERCPAPFAGPRCNQCTERLQEFPYCRNLSFVNHLTSREGKIVRHAERFTCALPQGDVGPTARHGFYSMEEGHCVYECKNGWTGDHCEFCAKPFTGARCNQCINVSRVFPQCYDAEEKNRRARTLYSLRETAVINPVGYATSFE